MSSCDLCARNIDLWFNKSVHVTSFTSRRVRFMSRTVLSGLLGFLVLVFCPCKLQCTCISLFPQTSNSMKLGDATIKVNVHCSSHSQSIIINQVRIREARPRITQHCIVSDTASYEL